MNKIMTPGMIAATIAGGGIGTAAGFMSKGEELENAGASEFKQTVGSVGGGLKGGLVGAGIGVGTAGTIVALRNILGKRL